MSEVLFVCYGNLCRSPSAALLLREELARAGITSVTVRSAGIAEADVGTPLDLVDEAQQFGIDLADHIPHVVDTAEIDAADLVIGMTREHLRETVVAVPSSFSKTFTLREIVRRGLLEGTRSTGENLRAWLARLHVGRRRADFIGASLEDDVLDPMGGMAEDYRFMLAELATLTEALRELAWPTDATGGRLRPGTR